MEKDEFIAQDKISNLKENLLFQEPSNSLSSNSFQNNNSRSCDIYMGIEGQETISSTNTTTLSSELEKVKNEIYSIFKNYSKDENLRIEILNEIIRKSNYSN